jgi:hypothetical protein
VAGETVRSVLNLVLGALEPLGCSMALTGGAALAVWNYPRATRDVDLLIDVDVATLDRVIDCLRACGCRPKKSPPLVSLGKLHIAQFLYTPPGEFYDVQFDLLLADSDLHKSALARRVQRSLPGVDRPLDVLHCDDLVLVKLLAGRMIDLADAAMLLRENRGEIDVKYLVEWVNRLGLTPEFAEVWSEAFPGESPPLACPLE